MNRIHVWSFAAIVGLVLLGGVGRAADAGVELPIGYQRLDYIESTGTQYIRTGYIPTTTTWVECEVDVSATQIAGATWATVFGGRVKGSSTEKYSFFSHSNTTNGDSNPTYAACGVEELSVQPFIYGERTRLVCRGATATWTGLESGTTGGCTQSQSTPVAGKVALYLFQLNEAKAGGDGVNSYCWMRMKLYSFKIYEGDVLVHDYVPCRDEWGEAVLFDGVTRQPLRNAGTGTFRGNDEETIALRLNCLRSSGTQYIRTGCTLQAHDKVNCTVNVNDVQPSGQTFATIFGARAGTSAKNAFVFFSHYNTVTASSSGRARYGRTGEEAQGDEFVYGRKVQLECQDKVATWYENGARAGGINITVGTINDCINECYAFCLNDASGSGGHTPHGACHAAMSLYSFSVTRGSTTVCDLIPWRTADGAIGLYDLASGALRGNSGSGAFAFDFAYTIDGSTLQVYDGRLVAEDLGGFAVIEKKGPLTVDASAVTEYPALKLTQGIFSLQDGQVGVYAVQGKLTLTGGARLCVDATADGADAIVPVQLDLTGASAMNPVYVRVVTTGISAPVADQAMVVIASGLSEEDEEKFCLVEDGFQARFQVRNGALVMVAKPVEQAEWTGAAGDGLWSTAHNWVNDAGPGTGTVAFFNGAAATTGDDLTGLALKALVFGESAGAYTHTGSTPLTIWNAVSNTSERAQMLSMPVALGVTGQTVSFHANGPLLVTNVISASMAAVEKTGEGPLSVAGTIFAAPEVRILAGTLTIDDAVTPMLTGEAATGTVVIAEGARLDLNYKDSWGGNNSVRSSYTSAKDVHVAGHGPDGRGAIVSPSSVKDDWFSAFTRMYLDGDASIGGARRIDFHNDWTGNPRGNGDRTFLYGPGKTLTSFNTALYGVLFCKTDVTLGKLVVGEGGHLGTDGLINLNLERGLELMHGATFDVFSSTIRGTGTVMVEAGNMATINSIAGDGSVIELPLAVAADATLNLITGRSVAFAGAVTNEGAFAQTGGQNLTFAGTLSGNGTLSGAHVRFAGDATCWKMTVDVDGFTSKVDASGVTDPAFLSGLRRVAVTCVALPSRPLAIAPLGALTLNEVNRIELTVADLEGTALPNCWLGTDDGFLTLHVADARMVRTAVWLGTGEAAFDSAANWLCSNDMAVVEQGLPMSATSIRLPDGCEFNCTNGAPFVCREVVLPKTLGGDCDWRGITAPFTGEMTLGEHEIKVSSLAGGALIGNGSDYLRLDYIESTGAQYIRTEYVPKTSTWVECEVDVNATQLDGAGWAAVFGGRVQGSGASFDQGRFSFFTHSNTTKGDSCPTYAACGVEEESAQPFIYGERTRLVCQGATATWTGLVSGTTGSCTLSQSTTVAGKVAFYLFQLNEPSTANGNATNPRCWMKMKLYSFKIYEGTTLVRDFVPVVRVSDGQVGLLDRAHGNPTHGDFYGNSGSGVFMTGPMLEGRAGVITIDVPEGRTVVADTMTLAGNVRMVKAGAGTLVAAKAGQTYRGGTRIEAGTLKFGTAAFPLGPLNVPVSVAEGATLDMNGFLSAAQSVYSYDWAGNVLQTTGKASNGYEDGGRCVGDIVLTGDAAIRGKYFYFANPLKGTGTITFNGNTLTIDSADYIGIGPWQAADKGGTLHYTGSGHVELYKTNGQMLTNALSVFECPLKVAGEIAVGGLRYTAERWLSSFAIPVVDVYGVYEAGAMRPPLKLLDGATVDLRNLSETWSVDGIQPEGDASGMATYFDAGRVTFATNAVIRVDLRGNLRRPSQVISWSETPATLDFRPVEGANYWLTVKDDGVYFYSGMAIFIR